VNFAKIWLGGALLFFSGYNKITLGSPTALRYKRK